MVAKNCLQKLLDGSNELRSVGVLREVMENYPYNLLKIQKRLCRSLLVWTQDVFETPVLRHHVVPRDKTDRVGRLRRARAVLQAEGEDPLEESLALAEGLAGLKRSPASIIPERAYSRYSSSPKRRRKLTPGALLRKKETATRLAFDDDDEDYDDELSEPGDDHNANLSELPRRRAIRVGSPRNLASRTPSPNKTSQKKMYDGRRLWTDEQKTAIKEGMRQLGKGKWADIKQLYKVLLSDRTSGQIKVCLCKVSLQRPSGRAAISAMEKCS
jgi:hypothetical protein